MLNSNLDDFKNINAYSQLSKLSFNELALQGTSIAMIRSNGEGTPNATYCSFYMVITETWAKNSSMWCTQIAIAKKDIPKIYVRSCEATHTIDSSVWYCLL